MKRSRRTRADDLVPPVLPLIRMHVLDDGTMQVTVDGAPYRPPDFAPAWRRDSFSRIIDTITQQRTSGARVEVIESDGHTFTDLIAPTRRSATSTHAQATPATPDVPATPEPAKASLTAGGFLPGEGVAIAIVVHFARAGADGTCAAVFDRRQFTGTPTHEALLFGTSSGAVARGVPG